MFHVARFSEPVCSCETPFKPPDDIVGVKENSSVVSPRADERTISTTDQKGKEFKSLDGVQSSVMKEQTIMKEQSSVPAARIEMIEQNSKTLQLPVQSLFKQGISSASGNSIKSGSQIYNLSFSGISMSTSSSMGNMLSETSVTGQSSKVSSKSNETRSTTTHVDSMPIPLIGLQSMGKPNGSEGHTLKSSLLGSSGSIAGDSPETVGIQKRSVSQSFSTSIQPSVKFSKALLRSGHNELAPAIHISSASLKENCIPGKSLMPTFQNALSITRVSRASAMQESEPKLSKQFYSVNEMEKELDMLLADIEQQGGFRDACTVSQRSLVLSLEESQKNLSEKFRIFKAKVEKQLQQIQQLQDKRMQVSARQIYMEGLVTQASNGQYWDIWNSQKLGPEFEVKQQRISKLNHVLVNELVELERHFNALELKKYGDSGAAPKGRRALLGSLGSSRQIYSLDSLYNTVNSQLAAADQLSECLLKQMAVLNINSPPSKRQSITKELLESIGLEYDADSFQSPDSKRADCSPNTSKKSSFLSSSRETKEHARRNTVTTLKTFEPESSRRRRDSLDRSWTRFDPPKTTVKRMLQDEHFKVGLEKSLNSDKEVSILPTSEGFPASQKHQEVPSSSSSQSSMSKFQSRLEKFNQDDENKLPKQLSEYQMSSPFKWTKDLSQAPKDVQRFSTTSEMQTSSIQSTPVAMSSSLSRGILGRMQELGGLADKSKYEQSSIVMHSDSSVGTDSLTKARFSAQFDASVRNQASVGSSFSPPKITPSVKAVQSSESLNVKSGEDGFQRSSKGSMYQAITPERSFSMSEKSHLSLRSTVSGNVSQVKAATSRSQSSGAVSSTTFSTTMMPSSSEQSSAAASVSLLSVTTSPAATSSLKHFEGSYPITASSVILSQTSLPSISSVAPVVPVQSSSASFQPQISKTSVPVSSPSENVTSQSPLVTSQPSIVGLQSTASKESEPSEVLLKSQPTLLPTSEVSTGLTADKKSSLLSSAVSPASSASHSLSEISFGSSNLLSTPVKGKDESFHITITEEDEMEEEAPEANTTLNLSALGGFALGPTTVPSAPKTNPFGGSLITNTVSPTSASFSLTTPTGELFRPASFSLPYSQPMQASQPMNSGGFSGGFSGFGQPAQIGAGQQALGSVLGAFGQSRQLGVGAQGSGFASSGGFGGGGFQGAAMGGGGGFAAAAAGGGFSAVASGGGSFAAVPGGGFAAMASKSSGFAAAAASGSGFTSGGFGSFAAKQSAGGFSQFGGTNTTQTEKPPAELLMQMRK